MKFPVHCCCTPGLRLGWVEVPEDIARGGVVMFARSKPLEVGPPYLGPGAVMNVAPTIRAQLRTIQYPARKTEILSDGTLTVPVTVIRPAFDSGDQPIEAWREVPGFIEDQKVYQ